MGKIFQRAWLLPSLMALTATPAWAKNEPLTLKPSSQWIVNYGDNSCRMMRQFGEGDQKITALFNRYGPGDSFRLTVAGKATKRIFSEKVRIQFGPNEEAQDLLALEGTFATEPAIIFPAHMKVVKSPEEKEEAEEADDTKWSDAPPPPIEEARLAAIKEVVIGKTASRQIRLQTGAMAKPFAAFSACVDNLVASWGVDPQKDKALKQRVRPAESPGRWITTNDYPMAMLTRGQPAVVQFRMNVDATGKATDCYIQETTRPKDFDKAVCGSLMKRAHFTPALDAEGNAVPSYWRCTVRFALP